MEKVETVQDIINRELATDVNNSNQNDMLEVMDFMRLNGVPLTSTQVSAFILLAENGLTDIAQYANSMRETLTPKKTYFELINKITLADRIKGTAKLDKILKAQVASPNNAMPNSNEFQAKALREKELR